VKLRLSCFAVVSLAAASIAAAQTFKSGVDLVRFDVRVVDDGGKSITDLRPDEIDIYENGKRLPIVLFQRVTEPAESYVDAAVRAVTAEISSNEAFPRGHLYILIFDQEHITPGNEQKARRAASSSSAGRCARRIASRSSPCPVRALRSDSRPIGRASSRSWRPSAARTSARSRARSAR
jgi:hypothetical protein